ncbi:type II toxin-antitoxin system VapC family toxin [Candidatus Magnetominusculus dajiuhuensis]|uniref:type II toxin-antitoxin system VapC family toxin n=1 Tax=Candidatus Magnetominusculus dajiuhuensis TaxID=3137712 RepID=UPI003B439580
MPTERNLSENSQKYLIDTDWLIDLLKGVGLVREKLREFSHEGLSISIISLAEIYEGIFDSKTQDKQQQSLDAFLTPDLVVLGIDADICKVFAKQRKILRKNGLLIDDFDLLIAATAICYDLVIL